MPISQRFLLVPASATRPSSVTAQDEGTPWDFTLVFIPTFMELAHLLIKMNFIVRKRIIRIIHISYKFAVNELNMSLSG